MKIEQVNLDKIKVYWRNPRNNDGAVDTVADSIQEFGFQNPIVLDKEYVIIAGHTRYRAAKKLNLKEVPCIIADLDEKKAKAYRIIDNKSGEKAVWDWDKLTPELRELRETWFQKFEIHHPELVIREINVEIKEVSTDDVKAKSEDLGNVVNETIEERKAQKESIICPHCYEEIEL